MCTDGQWGTEVELVALANALGTTIIVTNDVDHDEQFQNWICPPTVQTDKVILLGFSYHTRHYYSLQSKQCYTVIILLLLLVTGWYNMHAGIDDTETSRYVYS